MMNFGGFTNPMMSGGNPMMSGSSPSAFESGSGGALAESKADKEWKKQWTAEEWRDWEASKTNKGQARHDRKKRAQARTEEENNERAQAILNVDPLHQEMRPHPSWGEWVWCRLCGFWSDWNHCGGRRHETRLYWEACGWDWSAADAEFEEAGRRHDGQDFDWEPVAVKGVLLVKDPKVPVMTRLQAEESFTRLWDLVEYLQKVS